MKQLISITLLLTISFSFGQEKKDVQKMPNIIFVLADDLGWGDLGCYGNKDLKTPQIDKLASQGTLFTQFYMNAAWCAPSRTAIMTGRFPSYNQFDFHNRAPERRADGRPGRYLDPENPNITQILKTKGYTTGHYGKWHLGADVNVPSPGEYGIDEFCVRNSSSTPNYKQRYLDGEFNNLFSDFNREFVAHSTEIIVDDAIDFIERNKDKPFYLNLWTFLPHAMLNPTNEQTNPYKKHMPPVATVNPGIKGALAIYYGSVTALDKQLGRLFDKIEEMGIADNTMIIFTSDNGPEDIHNFSATHSGVGSTGPFRGNKRSAYEGGVRMPLLVKWKGNVEAGRVDTHSVIAGTDLLPTFCDIIGIETKNDWKLDGESVSDMILAGGEARDRTTNIKWRHDIVRELYHQGEYHKSPSLAIREGGWKLLINPNGSEAELYNILTDPMEMRNMVNEKLEIAKTMKDELLKWNSKLPYNERFENYRKVKHKWQWPKEKRGE